MSLERESYRPRHIRALEKALRSDALERRVGSAVCPFCRHLEARWRSHIVDEAPLRVHVRVRCSQCQLSTTFDLPKPRGFFRRLISRGAAS